MKLAEVELLKVLPPWIRDDAAVFAICMGLDPSMRELAAEAALLTVWDKIDILPEERIDELAFDMNMPWYEDTAPIATKRELLKNAGLIRSKLGTGFAVDLVITAYFGSGKSEDWFEYGGEPGYFRITTDNPAVADQDLTKFLRLLYRVKRNSAHLDKIIVNIYRKFYTKFPITSAHVTHTRVFLPQQSSA